MYEEDNDDFGKSYEKIRKMPIFVKAQEILDLVMKIIELAETEVDEIKEEFERESYKHHISYLAENSMIIPAKISGAEAAEIYDLKMENAAIIRKAARELLTDSTGLKSMGFKHADYINILRDEVEAFRILFAEWVKTFDPWDYIIDRWGLFNPPGINYDDHDPDDDIPFNPDDFLGDL